LEVFYIVFLSALALLLCIMALTAIGKTWALNSLKKIGGGDILV
jgi:hypothetical protein